VPLLDELVDPPVPEEELLDDDEEELLDDDEELLDDDEVAEPPPPPEPRTTPAAAQLDPPKAAVPRPSASKRSEPVSAWGIGRGLKRAGRGPLRARSEPGVTSGPSTIPAV
jgi:hypothetical protein